ncbi:hypothetical protein [Poseidonocella sedimentorum]|uniref:hypothetical protein n=1 Tax=Poseidonocella sedimentorum TaxID=871652 RepID=UPI000B890A3C|nr:hypothetical protein [Poseidonocella sedimentorum]
MTVCRTITLTEHVGGRGPIPVDRFAIGDTVETADIGPQPTRHILRRALVISSRLRLLMQAECGRSVLVPT